MAKAREKVQQSGFWDPEVKESAHDTICLWAYNHAEAILRVVSGEDFDRVWDPVRDAVWTPDLNLQPDNFEELRNRFFQENARPNPRVINKQLEAVLTAQIGHNRKFEQRVGFADLMITAHNAMFAPIFKHEVGYDRVFQRFELQWARPWRVLVEAKSVLPTLGELMRQIQHYRTAHEGPVVVIAPDAKYADILKEQGVWFIPFKK